MGIEAMINGMNPKKRKLIENLFVVGFMCTLAYTFITLGVYGGDVMAFMQSSTMITIVVLLIFTYMGWSVVNKGKLSIPQQKGTQQKKPQKQPQKVSVRKKQPHLSIPSQPKKTPSRGSMKCPRCNSLIMGEECRQCGYRRQ